MNVSIPSGEDRIELWNARTGVLEQTLETPCDLFEVWEAAISPFAELIASASDNTICLWRISDGKVVRTWDLGSRLIAFSADATHLHIDTGVLQLPQDVISAPPEHRHPRAYSVRNDWIWHGDDRIIWLPPEHRPSYCAIHGNVLAFGTREGDINFMELAYGEQADRIVLDESIIV